MDIRETAAGMVFKVRVAPNAGKNAVVGEYNGMLKVKIAAAPEKGKANEELISYLSGLLKISKSRIAVTRGKTSREKTISVSGVKKQDILKLLQEEKH